MSVSYGGINAKVKAMKGRLLSNEEYVALSCCKSVDEVGRRLGERPAYADVLGSIEGEIHRGELEGKLLLSLCEDFGRIYSFVSDFQLKEYLDAFFLKYEVDVLKRLICVVYDERNITYSPAEVSTLLGKKTKIDVAGLVRSQNLKEFIGYLEGTVFYQVLSQYYEENPPSLFELETRLDIYYYLHVWSFLKRRLDKGNQKVMTSITGTEIDLRNIEWIYRLRMYYHIDDAVIYANLIPIHHRLSKESVTRMVESKNEGELLAEIEKTPYGPALQGEKNLEMGYRRVMTRAFHMAEMNFPNSIAAAVAYLYHKEIEIKNIVSLLEGIRYGLNQEAIRGYLVFRGNAQVSMKEG